MGELPLLCGSLHIRNPLGKHAHVSFSHQAFSPINLLLLLAAAAAAAAVAAAASKSSGQRLTSQQGQLSGSTTG